MPSTAEPPWKLGQQSLLPGPWAAGMEKPPDAVSSGTECPGQRNGIYSWEHLLTGLMICHVKEQVLLIRMPGSRPDCDTYINSDLILFVIV